jgi:hypothetical protein
MICPFDKRSGEELRQDVSSGQKNNKGKDHRKCLFLSKMR